MPYTLNPLTGQIDYYDSPVWADDGTDVSPVNSRNVEIPDGKMVKFNSLTVPQYYDTSILTDGSVETWDATGNMSPDDWVQEYPGIGGVDYSKTTRSTDKYAGTYAASLECYVDQGGGVYASSLLTNISAIFGNNQTVQLRTYAKQSVGTPSLAVIYSYLDALDNDYYYHFTGALAGTWVVSLSGPPSEAIETISLSGSYTQKTSTQATSPASGVVEGFVTVVAIGSNGDKMLLDNTEVLIDSVDAATNGTWENWTATTPTTLTSWIEGYWGVANDEAGIIREATTVQSGTYSAKLYRSSDNQPYIGQLKTGLTAGHTYRFRYYGRKDGTSSVNARGRVALFDDTPGSASQYYNFTTNAWVSYTPATTEPGTDFYVNSTLTDSFQQFTLEEFVVPASGKLAVVVWIGGNNTDILYFDNADLMRNVPDHNPTLVEITNPTTATDIATNQVLEDVYTTGGTDKRIRKITNDANGNAVVTTEFGAFDYSSQDHIVGIETFEAASAPGTPVAGDTWQDSTQKCLKTYEAGVTQALTGCLFTQTNTVSVGNTTNETTIVGTGVGTVTLPANFFVAGKKINLFWDGYFRLENSPTLQVKIKIGSTTVWDSGAVTKSAVSTGTQYWRLNATLTCRTTGASGTVLTQALYEYIMPTRVHNVFENVKISTATIDTTASQAIDITVQWGTADTNNIHASTGGHLIALN